MESDIMNADIPDSEKNKLMKNFLHLKQQKINLNDYWCYGMRKEFNYKCII